MVQDTKYHSVLVHMKQQKETHAMKKEELVVSLAETYVRRQRTRGNTTKRTRAAQYAQTSTEKMIKTTMPSIRRTSRSSSVRNICGSRGR